MHFTLTDAILAAADLATQEVDAFVSISVPDVEDAITLARQIVRSDGDSLIVIRTRQGVDLIACDRNEPGVHVWKVAAEGIYHLGPSSFDV